MNIDDIVEIVCCGISGAQTYPEVYIYHAPTKTSQTITIVTKHKKVFSIEVKELKD